MFYRTDVTQQLPIEAGIAGESTRLLIADGSAALRMGLRMIFGLDSTIEITAETGTSEDMELLALQTRPHVIVFDADMPGIERSLSFVLRALPGCRMIAMTMQTSPHFHAYVLALGATACIEKRASPMELLEAVQDARGSLGHH
jgi:DNA-binding NarL/FixJ family response regulator